MVNNGIITAPINMRDPYECMGVSATANGYDLGYICSNQHGKINWRSLYKPIRSMKLGELTDSDYFSLNFGYTIPVYSTFSAMKNGVSDGWTYSPPTGGDSSPYRLLDFNKYDHHAKAPFNMELVSGSPNLGDTCMVSIPTDIMWLTNWDAWSAFQGSNIQYLNCGFYVPGVGYYPLTDTDQGLTIPDLDMEKLSFEVSRSYFSANGTYKVYLVLTTWDGLNGARRWYNPDDTVAGSWWVLATDSPLSFTVKPELTPLQYISVTGSGTATMQEEAGYYRWKNVNINIGVSVSENYPYSSGQLSISIVVPNHYPGTGTHVESKTIFSTSFPNISAGFSQTVENYASSFNLLTDKGDNAVNTTMEIRLTIGTKLYTTTRNLTIYDENV